MSSIKICKCGSLASWNSYFGGYCCHNCGLILEDGLPDGGRGGHLMEMPKEFVDVFHGVELTEDEIRTLTWIAGWESRTVKNLCSAMSETSSGT